MSDVRSTKPQRGFMTKPRVKRSAPGHEASAESEPQRGSMTKPRVSAKRATLGRGAATIPNPNGVVYLRRLLMHTTPHEITQLVAKQPKWDEGDFLVFPRPNLFFVAGKRWRSRCFVWVSWDGQFGCWCVNLIRFNVKNDYQWNATCRLFLRA